MIEINTLYSFFYKENIKGINCIDHIFTAIKQNNSNLNLNELGQLTISIKEQPNDKSDKSDKSISNQISSDVINNIFDYHFKNDSLTLIKEYYDYYNNPIFADWIYNFIKPINTFNKKILDGSMKINSFLSSIIKNKNNIDLNKIYGLQTNPIILNLCEQELGLKFNINSNNILYEDIIINNTPAKFNLIFFDITSSKRNIIHANCCNRIKKLRIRGTKYEPLLLQLIMLMLEKNGRAFIIVPDSLLYGDSNQIIETRKYLIDNFNLMNVFELDENIYHIKGNKRSILYFENNGTTTNIHFSKLNLENNMINTENIMSVNINEIKTNNYSLFHKKYIMKTIIIGNNISSININNVIDFKSSFKQSDNIQNILVLANNYKNSNSIKVISSTSIINSNNETYLIEKQNNYYINGFIYFYLEYILNKKINLYIEGSTNKINIDMIKNMDIPIISHNVQKSIYNYYTISNEIYNNNKKQIDDYNNLKTSIMDAHEFNDYIELKDICNIHTSSEITKNTNIISILRNGLNAGTIKLDDSMNLSNNMYYIYNNNNNFTLEYIYNYLWYKYKELNSLANLTTQTNLTKSSLSTFKIANITLEQQKIINSLYKYYNNMIDKNIIANIEIKEKDINSIILNITS